MHTSTKLAALVLALGATSALGFALAEDPADKNEHPSATHQSATHATVPGETRVQAAKVYRASTIIGMPVRNAQGEDLGTIDDLVLDMGNGTIRYAALSFGGFLGVGDKLFAVPMKAMVLKHDADESHFVFNVTKERLEGAPGFDRNAWPASGDALWTGEIDEFYRDDGRTTAVPPATTRN